MGHQPRHREPRPHRHVNRHLALAATAGAGALLIIGTAGRLDTLPVILGASSAVFAWRFADIAPSWAAGTVAAAYCLVTAWALITWGWWVGSWTLGSCLGLALNSGGHLVADVVRGPEVGW